jgi:hypothetical protein
VSATQRNPTFKLVVAVLRFSPAALLGVAGILLGLASLAAVQPQDKTRSLALAHGNSGFNRQSVSPLVPASAPGGSWTIVNSANGGAVNDIVGLTCVSASDCWGVGRQRNGSIWQTLIEHWDGSAWTLVASPNTSTSDGNFLYGVSCTSSSQCWAVGDDTVMNFGVAHPLIEQWNGTAWTIYSSPLANPVATDGILSSVTCTAVSDCWAVGYQLSGNFNQTLIQHWNGSVWLTVTSANTSAVESNVLNNVACTSASDCWAVGNHDVGTPVGGAAPQATLTEHWDGNSWSIVSSPNPTINYDVLYSVSCTSSSDCTAVGLYNLNAIYQTLVEHWDGSSWQVAQSPNPNANQDNALESVTCNSASDCWAVGYFNAGNVNNPLDDTLIIHWDGSLWSVVSSPNRSTYQFNFLNAVTCVSANECWAAGASDTPNAVTLVEHYGSSFTLVSAASRKTHGFAGTFDVDLPFSFNLPVPPPGIECRVGGGSSGGHTLVFNFNNMPVSGSASVVSGTGSVSGSPTFNGQTMTVNLTGVTNAQVIGLILNVTDNFGQSFTNPEGIPINMGVLLGDVNGNGVVSNTDVSLVKAQVAASVSLSNFREDVNANGVISNTDVSLTKAQVGATLPSPP